MVVAEESEDGALGVRFPELRQQTGGVLVSLLQNPLATLGNAVQGQNR